ncbi:MAG TPA: aminotransferase class V-fold PLP-dependent enzyme [Gemmatimonadales bacterium]|nr:aminotransferase class V-fold PLP-dependent enzyme [Gemmatimonadales bacterium]
MPGDATSHASWQRLVAEIEGFEATIRTLPPVNEAEPAALRAALASRFRFDAPIPLDRLTEDVIGMLRSGLVHVTHPRYFGLFNPSTRPAAVMGDALAALYNPQLAAWSHAPVVQELERHVLATLAGLLGYDGATCGAHFTSGGAEANFTAVQAALADRCPGWSEDGLTALPRRPVLYVTGESHHSFLKIARMAGLGTSAIREVPVTERLQMDVTALDAMMTADAASGLLPLLVVGTAGTTSAGVVDPLHAIADVAARHGAWFHADAAWGGGAAMSPRLRPLLDGIARADSITWDAHKWLSVPMGAGMIFTRHPEAFRKAFGVHTSYMPPAADATTVDPYHASAQWSRRATGLKLFCALAELGLDGYAALIDHQAAMGELLRDELRAAGWIVVNDTPLPVVNTTHPRIRSGERTTAQVRDRVYARGRTWISEVMLTGRERTIRACITSYLTTAADVQVLVEELNAAVDGEG